MGLSNFPSAAEGVLPVLVMNTVLSVALLKNMVRSVLQVMGASNNNSSSIVDDDDDDDSSDGFISSNSEDNSRARRISITKFKSLCDSRSSTVAINNGGSSSSSSSGLAAMECCVCLNGFQADEEVSELCCKHFFHRGCLDKWVDNKHSTCPLCRSIL